MKKQSPEFLQGKPIESWWTSKKPVPGAERPFPVFACVDAEGFFLSFLYYLASHTNYSSSVLTPQKITLLSSDLKSAQPAVALEKTDVVEGGLSSKLMRTTKLYQFGENTFLVLKGPLAGTIARRTPYTHLGLIKQKNAIKKGTVPATALRPFYNHARVWDQINWNANIRDKFSKADHHQLNHYLELQRYSNSNDALWLLLDWLYEADIPHDADTMLKNAILWQALGKS